MLALAAVLSLNQAVDAQTAAMLKVLDWNTHHGVGSDGVYNIDRFVPCIASSGANVVSLNEVEKFTSWGNEDQPARYAAMLQAATGRPWHYTFAQRDGAANGQGNLILTTFPIVASGQTVLSYSRSVARVQIVVNGVTVNIFSTHLDADSTTRRVTQMAELKTWASSFSQQHIFAGDFNAWPGAAEIANMMAFANDAWAAANTQGTSVAYSGNEAGNTRNSRIDYIWYAKTAAQLTLKGARVFDTRDAGGVTPSDHRPVMATFEVGAAAPTLAPPRGLRIMTAVGRLN
jgi:endonuclease/exonuclease/phosphatase family metal-dependent hydrolase